MEYAFYTWKLPVVEKGQMVLSWDSKGLSLGVEMLRMVSASSLLYRELTSDKSLVLVTGFMRLATHKVGSKVEGFFGLNQAGCWSGSFIYSSFFFRMYRFSILASFVIKKKMESLM
ncbi:hypothetical protein ACJW31_07G020200 [Castanea mollissima]